MGLGAASRSFLNWDIGHPAEHSRYGNVLPVFQPPFCGWEKFSLEPWLSFKTLHHPALEPALIPTCPPSPHCPSPGRRPLAVPHTGHPHAPILITLCPLLNYLSPVCSLWQTPTHPLRPDSKGLFSLWVSPRPENPSLSGAPGAPALHVNWSLRTPVAFLCPPRAGTPEGGGPVSPAHSLKATWSPLAVEWRTNCQGLGETQGDQ